MSINYSVKYVIAAVALMGSGLSFAESKAEIVTADLWLQAAKGGYSVEFVSDGEIAGLQFDVQGLSVAEGQYDCGVGLADSHVANCSINSDGNLRVIVFSMDNAPVPDGTMVFIRNASPSAKRAELLTAARQAAAPTLSGVLLADAEATDVTPDHLK
ncbi:MAG TPA: hypothetical protein VKO85_12020 [Wenzhouxiangellaceae bacterium]|nr:hypothetical protein [Wenzhouxiangellaceae bacterium]